MAGGFQPFVSSQRMKVPRNSCAAWHSQRLLLHGCCSSCRPCQSHQRDRGQRQPDRLVPGVHRQDGSRSGCRQGEGSAAGRLPAARGWWMEQDKESCCAQMRSDSKLKHENFAQGLFTCWHYLACVGSLQGFGLQAMRGEPWTPIGIRGRGCCLVGCGVAVPPHCCAWRVLPPPPPGSEGSRQRGGKGMGYEGRRASAQGFALAFASCLAPRSIKHGMASPSTSPPAAPRARFEVGRG